MPILRYSRRQSTDRALIHIEQPRHRALRLAGIELPEHLLLLVARQLGWPTELDARLTRPLDADVSAQLDQTATEAASPSWVQFESQPMTSGLAQASDVPLRVAN